LEAGIEKVSVQAFSGGGQTLLFEPEVMSRTIVTAMIAPMATMYG